MPAFPLLSMQLSAFDQMKLKEEEAAQREAERLRAQEAALQAERDKHELEVSLGCAAPPHPLPVLAIPMRCR